MVVRATAVVLTEADRPVLAHRAVVLVRGQQLPVAGSLAAVLVEAGGKVVPAAQEAARVVAVDRVVAVVALKAAEQLVVAAEQHAVVAEQHVVAAEQHVVVAEVVLEVAAVSDREGPAVARLQYNRSAKQTRGGFRSGFTLVELMLSLALIMVATALIGTIMQLYSRNFTKHTEDIRRQQLARAILNMIADDIRAVVLEQEYDGTVLEQQLGASSGGGSSAPAGSDDGGSGLASDSGASSSLADSSSSLDGTTETGLTISTSYPPGIYGDQYSLIVEVSRLPRHDEYIQQQGSLISGTIMDVPGDIKTVQYLVQTQSTSGVTDDMQVFGATPSEAALSTGMANGLVRRALDRGVTAYAEEMGNSDQLQRTGELVAPEVISLEFAYYDGNEGQWLYEWDSSQQSLPWLVQISLAIQSEDGAAENPIAPGTQLSTITFEDQQAYGISVYELVVAIPGANLVGADAAAAADQADGMNALGL